MLYVFHVDVGRMMSFDMTVALSSVENLKATIERLHNIPAANIVLLVSGGELLTESTQVSCYSAGTDTNPIYMFLTGEVRVPSTMPQTDIDLDLRDQVERSMELPAVYDTVITRAQLASKMYEHARDEERFCERLVHDQHLQQQGWSAVVANMEDLTDEFRLRFRNFSTYFDSHMLKRGVFLELLNNFAVDLDKLSRIPILPGLMAQAEADFHGFDEYLDKDDVFSRSNMQQESVLMAGAAKSHTSETSDQPSTSPHKKAKIGEHEADNTEPTPSSTHSSKVTAASSENSAASGAMRRNTLNLLQWITSKENHNALQIMCGECVQGLETLNEDHYEKLKIEVQSLIKFAEQTDVKEIKGLGERLMRLEEFKFKVKGMVQDQKELSTAFQQNQNRAINLRDPSILPDLCASHRSQLQVMLQNHKKIIEHRRCIAKSKDELGGNLHMRLGRIVVIENAMSDFDNRLLFNHRALRRAERHISIIEQIHQAPCIYVAAVTEVVRRKIFSEEFRTWASKLCDDFESIHSEEIKRRETFNSNFDGHFLNILFPGMNDMPPAFANENPLNFDGRLPNLTKSDIDMLSAHLPDLAAQFHLPDMQPIIRFFVSRSGEHQKARWEQMLKDEAMDSTSTSNLALTEKPQNQRLLELQKTAGSSRTSGCDESETDTEIEFEKVLPLTEASSKETTETSPGPTNQETQVEPFTLDRSTITDQQLAQVTHAETLTDENESATHEELQRIRESLKMLSQHSLECIKMARANLTSVRTDAETYRNDLQSDIQTLQENCKMLQLRSEAREKETLEMAQLKQLELNELHGQLKHRDHEIEAQKEELMKLEQMQIKCFSLEEKLSQMRDEFDKEKETAVALAREELIHEHKTEIESLRCRFKLMTSMERSPSDMSLEKIERPTSRIAHDEQQQQQLMQETLVDVHQIEEKLKAQFEAEKEKAINAAVEAERMQWQSRLMLNSESVIANVGMLKVIEEKERQLEQLREREFMLTKENYQLKTRLDSLTNEDANSWLKEKIEYLNRDKERLEKELEKSKRVEMEASFAGLRGAPTEHMLPRSKSSSSSHKYAVLQSLDKGDVVFVVWSTMYGQYIVVQDSQSLFFVHGESLTGLKLRLPKREADISAASSTAAAAAAAVDDLAIPQPYHAIGVVLEKEYCQARKDKNRYRVPCGSKFYRVKLAPITIAQPIARVPRDRLESFSKSVSRSQSQCESQSEASSAAHILTGLEASVMQTDLTASTATTVGSPVTDTVDSSTMVELASGAAAGAAAAAVSTTTTNTASNNKNIEDEVTLLTERCRYASVSEEDELSVTSTTTNTNTTAPQKQSVITEQPTASNKFNQSANVAADATNQLKTHRPESGPNDSPAMPIAMELQYCAVAATGTTTATNATNEDSDEYRSLEGKEDEAEFGTFD